MRFAKKPWLNSLSAKVLLAYVTGSVLSIVLLASVAIAVVTSQGDVFSATDVANLTADLAGMLQFDPEGNPLAFDDGEGGLFSWLYESLKQETGYRVLDASGNAVLHSAAGAAFWPTSGPVGRLERGRFEFEHNGVAMRGATDREFLLNDVEHMSRQVQQLLVLAEASETQNYRFADVEVVHEVTEVAHFLRRMADAAEVQIVTPDGTSGPRWRADRSAFFTLLKNMTENAIQHAPRGTEVRIDVAPTELSVRDRGPGVAQEQLPHLFARFWRGGHRRDHGAGLGLAICQEIALAHGWTLSAHREEPGLRVCVSVPAREHQLPLEVR